MPWSLSQDPAGGLKRLADVSQLPSDNQGSIWASRLLIATWDFLETQKGVLDKGFKADMKRQMGHWKT